MGSSTRQCSYRRPLGPGISFQVQLGSPASRPSVPREAVGCWSSTSAEARRRKSLLKQQSIGSFALICHDRLLLHPRDDLPHWQPGFLWVKTVHQSAELSYLWLAAHLFCVKLKCFSLSERRSLHHSSSKWEIVVYLSCLPCQAIAMEKSVRSNLLGLLFYLFCLLRCDSGAVVIDKYQECCHCYCFFSLQSSWNMMSHALGAVPWRSIRTWPRHFKFNVDLKTIVITGWGVVLSDLMKSEWSEWISMTSKMSRLVSCTWFWW